MRVLFLIALLTLGCYAVRTHPCRAIAIGARVECNSVTGAFVGDTTPTQTTAVFAGIAAVVGAIGVAFF